MREFIRRWLLLPSQREIDDLFSEELSRARRTYQNDHLEFELDNDLQIAVKHYINGTIKDNAEDLVESIATRIIQEKLDSTELIEAVIRKINEFN